MTLTSAPGPTLVGQHLHTLTVTAAVGAGLAGGVFLAFSTFVMPALRHLQPSAGIEAMQSINRSAPNPVFMAVLFGTALLSVVLAVHGLRHRDEPGASYLVVGAAAYLVAIVLTAAYHVPHNNALALVDPHANGAAATWTRYYDGWTLLNHVRAVGCGAGAVLLTLAARVV